MYENCDSHCDKKVKQGHQSTKPQTRAYQRQSEVGSCTPKTLVSNSQASLPLRPYQPLRIPNNCPYIHHTKVEDEVGDDACLITRFACKCRSKKYVAGICGEEEVGDAGFKISGRIYWHLARCSYARCTPSSAQPRDFRGVTANQEKLCPVAEVNPSTFFVDG